MQRYPTPNNEDTCQQENYYYDTNTFDPNFPKDNLNNQYINGRLTAIQYFGGSLCNTTFTEMYAYNQAAPEPRSGSG